MTDKIVSVVGLGKIGLPLAVKFASKGLRVFGIDINEKVVQSVNAMHNPFPEERDLDKLLKKAVSNGLLEASTNFDKCISQSNVVIVVVPLVVDQNGEPDFASIDSATTQIGKNMAKETLVSFETTLPIGTTRNRFAQILEDNSKMEAGKDFYVAFSPERVSSGRIFSDLENYPKIVGGINEESERAAIEFYSIALDFKTRSDLIKPNGVWSLVSTEAAEFAKLAETTYRDVNIALVNQFAMFAQKCNVNLYEVIEACNSQPYSHLHQPGIAVGGHCIPVYPKMYLWNDSDARLVKVARTINEEMPKFAVKRLLEVHGDLSNQRVLILGASYRSGVKETAFSGVFEIKKELLKSNAIVKVNDPLYLDSELSALGLDPYYFGDEIDAIILHTNHVQYREIKQIDFPKLRTIIDGRGMFRNLGWPGVNIQIIGDGVNQKFTR